MYDIIGAFGGCFSDYSADGSLGRWFGMAWDGRREEKEEGLAGGGQLTTITMHPAADQLTLGLAAGARVGFLIG